MQGDVYAKLEVTSIISRTNQPITMSAEVYDGRSLLLIKFLMQLRTSPRNGF
jgi:hypothetical protein